MGHKGKNVRKAPKEKLKPFAAANPHGGAVSDLAQSENRAGQFPAKANAMPFGQGGSKKNH
jgi:hypothetical protein